MCGPHRETLWEVAIYRVSSFRYEQVLALNPSRAVTDITVPVI